MSAPATLVPAPYPEVMASTAHIVLIPGAGSDPAYWGGLRAELSTRGVASTAVDLPCTDESATLTDYADVVAAAVTAANAPVTLVAHSLGAFTAGLVPDRAPVQAIVLVAPMIPTPGESPGQWWEATGQPAAHEAAARAAGLTPPLDLPELFYNGCTDEQIRQGLTWNRDQAAAPFTQPWPRDAWPGVPTEVVAFAEDRLLPPQFLTTLAQQRLGLAIRTAPGGHMGMVSHPGELAEVLLTPSAGARDPR